MISAIHRRIVSTKAEWRADPARRVIPPLPEPIPWPAPIPIPVSHGRIRVSANARVYRFRQIAQLRPWCPVRILCNERRALEDGLWHAIEDLYLLLQTGPAPAELPPLRLIDLRHPRL
jgi:hypothetical protein